MYTTSDYDYDLPAERIAKYPLEQRAASRLLRVDSNKKAISHSFFNEIVDYLNPKDLLVLNNTKVIPARLFGRKQSGGQIECLIERILCKDEVLAHIRSSKSPKPQSRLILADQIEVLVLGRKDDLFHLKFLTEASALEGIEQYGQMPLPPYIDRDPEKLDMSRYQTVFADRAGAVAAPTAGLHFDQDLLDKIQAKGIETTTVTLHVGAGTFAPVRVDNLDDHIMHSEWMQMPQTACDALAACKARGGRVIAVGTTAVRTLESWAQKGAAGALECDTQLFIRPGFKFACVDALITNFHLPKSTLLMLVSAFGGYDLMRAAYREAIEKQYRFFSYGDAMLITR